MNKITTINEIAKALIQIDKTGKDFRITKNEFDLIKEDNLIIKALTGLKNTENIDWKTFKDEVILYQSNFGFEWKRSKGQYGTIKLNEIDLLDNVGIEISEILKKEGKKKGDINLLLKNYLKDLYDYVSDNEIKDLKFITKNVRNGLRLNKVKNNKKYLFTSRSPIFELKNEEYQYSGTENELGDLIVNEVGALLNLDYIEHSQVKRNRGKFENVDFEGYKIYKSVTNDDLEVYNFELKKSNSISDISSAISQAVNYKKYAHYTYIVIPFMNLQNFYEKERFNYFLSLCKENNIGVISIVIDKNENLEELNIIYNSPKTELLEIEHANELLEATNKEFCSVCNKIVNTGETRNDDCGWLVNISEKEKICQKQLQEQNNIFLQNFLTDKGYTNNNNNNKK